MRTTVELPDSVFRELKALAAHRGISMKSLIRSAVEVEIRKPETKTPRHAKFPILHSRKPGTLTLNNAEIDDLLA